MEQMRLRPEAASPGDLNDSAVCFVIFLVERPKLTFPARKRDLLTATGGRTTNDFKSTCGQTFFSLLLMLKMTHFKTGGTFFCCRKCSSAKGPSSC